MASETTTLRNRRQAFRAKHSVTSAPDVCGVGLGRIGFAFLVAVLSSTAAPQPINAQEDGGWLGKRVVQKVASLVLQMNDETVDGVGDALRIYRVEQVDDLRLLLKSESDRKSGWGSASDVVTVEQAVGHFTQKARLEPNNPFAFALLGLVRQDKREYDLAIGDYNVAIRLDPLNAAAFAGRGTARRCKGDLDLAIADFDAAIRLNPKNSPAYLGRGQARAARNQHTLAIADFSEAIWLDPLAVSAYDNRGRSWQSKGEYAKAIIDYNMMIRLDPQRASAYRRRGSCWEAEKQYGKAIADYNEAIRLEPGSAPAYRDLARLLATCPDPELRDANLAIVTARRACELTQWKEPAGLDALAAAYAAARDFESAVEWQIKSNALSRSPLEQKDGEARLNRYRDKRP